MSDDMRCGIDPKGGAGSASCLSELLTSEPVDELCFHFKCGCNLRSRLVGDGCSICNTEYSLDMLPQPKELADDLVSNGFGEDQACSVAEDIYQPLVSIICVLNNKIDQLAKALVRVS